MRRRYQNVVKTFFQAYGKPPQFIARAPGRVNIIGEHIDYCGFGVLPMAIERDVVMAVFAGEEVSRGDTVLSLVSTQPDVYSRRDVQYIGNKQGFVAIDASKHDWANYCSAGFKGVLETITRSVPRKMLCVVDGTVPGGSGLSSSSALVCCISMATMHAQGGELSAEQLVLLSIASERYVGVNGGGMDQACSFLSKKGEALCIEFSPALTAMNVPIYCNPPFSFIIANSLVISDKAATAPYRYNLRVAETRMAAAIMARHLGFSDKVGVLPTLGDVVRAKSLERSEDKLPVDCAIFALEVVIKESKKALKYHDEGYTLQQISEALEASEAEIKEAYLTKFPVKAEVFHLYKRTRHVLTEAQRVLQFRHLCLTAQTGTQKNFAQALGDLMNSSHNSCKLMYDCSCPELDRLTKLCTANGALGSRLTGAGWGGCTISLVPQPRVKCFILGLRDGYYPTLTDDEFNDAVFITPPSQGAALMKNIEHFV
ncbi:galactokinase [Massospora cicadina]|nr:galactokinase [Massospora cicadina]